MDFNFVDETQDEDEEFLDLSDLYEDEDENLQIAGLDIAFTEEVPEAMSITDPEVRRRAKRGRKKKSSNKISFFVGVANAPTLHGLCKQGRGNDGRILPAHHSLCQQYEDYHIRANHFCSCECHDYETTRKELEDGKDSRKSTSKSRRKRIRSQPEPLSGSSDEEFILVID